MKATLTKLSICPCGYQALNDSVKLGTIYDIEPSKRKSFVFICGSCKAQRTIVGVYANSRNGGRPGFLPEDLFSLIVL